MPSMNAIPSFRKLLWLTCVVLLSAVACKKKADTTPVLTADQSSLNFRMQGESLTVVIACNSSWTVSNPLSAWLQLNSSSGNTGNTSLVFTASSNSSGASRSGTVTITANNGKTVTISITQSGNIFPSYNISPKPADSIGMSSTAVQLAAKFKLGWNIGNTLEAIGGETNWGNPQITEAYIQALKQNGITAVRLPCSWNQYSNSVTAKIQDTWLARVKQVVQYCVNNDMYVLLNIHWDGGWLDGNINAVKKDSVIAKQRAFWEQIATTLRDFDEHLMFASANEPPVDNADQMNILLSYHQAFVDAVRSTGGKNSYRTLVVQGPSTDVDKTASLMNNLPGDAVTARMMVEVHYYTPFQFCALDGDASWGKMFYYWGNGHHSTIEPDRNASWGEESVVDNSFAKMKSKYTDKGIPVILGEFGAYRRNGTAHVPADLATHNDAVDYWITYVTKQAIANGLKPFFWDTGGIIDRAKYTVKDARTMAALAAGLN
jgi:aryl-phospho-beta-D-glucosidase BglC (GH1 family)